MVATADRPARRHMAEKGETAARAATFLSAAHAQAVMVDPAATLHLAPRPAAMEAPASAGGAETVGTQEASRRPESEVPAAAGSLPANLVCQGRLNRASPRRVLAVKVPESVPRK